MNSIDFEKMNGAGNDFILIDSQKNKNFNPNPEIIRKMCDRRKGIGADGILCIEKKSSKDFTLEYYNSDGSLGSLCGNGARCSIKYAFENLNIKSDLTNFLCNNEVYSGKIEKDGEITFNLGLPQNIKLDIPISLENFKLIGHFANTGSPHVVIFWDEICKYFNSEFNEFDVFNIGRKIRNAKEFSPEGTNVNIIMKENDQLYIRTYERGVEDETLACGTGTVASAIISYLKLGIQPPIEFNTFGIDKLFVNFVENNNKFSKISLTGPAKINYIGTYNF